MDQSIRYSSAAGPIRCEHVSELLPWLANGSLEPSEEFPLTQHLETCAACAREVADTLEAIEVFSSHVPSQVLAEYSLGLDLSELSREDVACHLESCAACREDLALLGEADHVVPFIPPQRPARYRQVRRSASGLFALAAVLAVTFLGGLAWKISHVDHSRLSATGADPTQSAALDREMGAAPVLLVDGFESGNLGTWRQTNAFEDGFESGKLGSWTAVTTPASPDGAKDPLKSQSPSTNSHSFKRVASNG